ncbi:MAG: SDR family NAD(P)-dependent oxidoreductase [Anaerolineae bacterium]|nr:SDR family oxidoreductase [Anaerolineae bacterium]MDW8099211.1 SDR family NAD(P)-dependent oxidoreductase [Anaerolineae bacterium]
MREPTSLQGKVIVITGGAQGIGAATAQLCATRGASVVIADVNAQDGEQVVASIRANGGEAWFHRTDVRSDEEVRALIEWVRERYGRLDVLIAAAGVLKGAYLQPEELSLEDFETVLDVNVKGIFLCAKYATPLLEASGHGVLIILASGAGVTGPSSSLAYGASKGGANGLGMTLAHHLAPRGIRVNIVCPGEIATRMKLSVIATEAQRAGRSPEEVIAEAQTQGRLGTPEGVARVIAFLASDEADYVRGTLFTR